MPKSDTEEDIFECFENYIPELNSIHRSPELFINSYCSSLKNQIDVAVESLLIERSLCDKQKDSINVLRNKMIDKIEEFEKDCLKNFDKSDFKLSESSALNESLIQSRQELERLRKHFVSNDQWFSNENRDWEESRKKLEHDLMEKIQILKKMIFLNKYYFFKENKSNLENDINFGYLILMDEIFNEKIINFFK